jgi:hypothetical protein
MSLEGRPAWVKGVGLGLLLFLGFYALVALEGEERREMGPPRRTTYSAGPGGYMVLYRWLQALQLPVQRWEKDLRKLPREASVLLVAEPESVPTGGEIQALLEWLRRGGTLVVLASSRTPFLTKFGLSPQLQLGRDQVEIRPVQPGPYTAGVRSMKARGDSWLECERPEAVFHAWGKGGGVLAVMDEGKGRVIALPVPELFSNTALKEEDNARLALNLLLEHRQDGVILLDEYHHGYGRSLLAHLGRSQALWPFLQGILLFLAIWALWGRRFGPVRPLLVDARRSSMEYVRSMAGLFQRAGARRLALEAAIQWTRDEAGKSLLEGDRSLQAALRSAEGRLKQRGWGDRDLLTAARGLYRALDAARSRPPGSWYGGTLDNNIKDDTIPSWVALSKRSLHK